LEPGATVNARKRSPMRNQRIEEVEGVVVRIRHRDPNSGFSVLVATIDGTDEALVGELGGDVEKGAKFIARGRWADHRKHGRQFKFDVLELRAPTSEEQTIARLKTYPGIGARTAESIVEQFGDRTWDVLDRSIEDILHIPGVGPKALGKIRAHHRQQSGPVAKIKNRMISVGAPASLAKAVHREFGERSMSMLDDHPFVVAARVERFGFRLAQKFARATGLDPEHSERVEAGVIHTMRQQRLDGHCGLPPDELETMSSDLLGVRRAVVDEAVERLAFCGALRYEAGLLLLSSTDRTEARVARNILSMTRPARAVWDSSTTDDLSDGQRAAVAAVARSGVTVLTGGPGTGKSTAVAAVLAMAERAGWEVTLCAPTGRAAKRLTETTGRPASTIHRLLRPVPGTGEFHFDESNSLPASLVIVDEVSMLDLELADALFAAMTTEHRVLLVGDADQLPSVGPGNILPDLLEAASAGVNISVVRLQEVFRQAKGSSIVTNAHRILAGEELEPDDRSLGNRGQFYILHASTPESAQRKLLHMAAARIPAAYDMEPTQEIQILCPTHRGPVGTEAFNSKLQTSYAGRHADSFWAAQKRRFCVGDRVMQMRNDYERNVFNGDIGTVTEFGESELTVDFDGAMKTYNRFDSRSLSLAFAMTIHKSQGGEFPAVLVPVLRNNRMLSRNLLYTAITRAKKLCILVGHRDAIKRAVTTEATRRWTRLTHRLVSAT